MLGIDCCRVLKFLPSQQSVEIIWDMRTSFSLQKCHLQLTGKLNFENGFFVVGVVEDIILMTIEADASFETENLTSV